MEEINLSDHYGTKIYAASIETLPTIEIGVIGDYNAVVVTKDQARELGEWLIQQSK